MEIFLIIAGVVLLFFGRSLYWFFLGAIGFVAGMKLSAIYLAGLNPLATLVVAMVAGIEEKREGHFEYVGHLVRIRAIGKGRLGPADDRCHAIAGGRVIFGKAAEDLDAIGRQSDFLFSFAQCGVLGRFVPCVTAPARKADLARMIGQVCRPLREDDRWIAGMVHDQQQNRRGPGTRERIGLLPLEVVAREEVLEP